MSARVAVYTAVTADIGVMRAPPTLDGCDYICFTDNPSLPANGWTVRMLPDEALALDPVRAAKWPKIFPHKALPDYALSLWIDENHDIVGDLAALTTQALVKADLAMFAHPQGRRSVFEEAAACLQLGKGDAEAIVRQVDHYRAQGFRMADGIPTCSIIARRHSSPDVARLMDRWWAEISTFSGRDQISFDYVRVRSETPMATISGDAWSNRWLVRRPHDRALRMQSLRTALEAANGVVISHPGSGGGRLKRVVRDYLRGSAPHEGDRYLGRATPEIAFVHGAMDVFENAATDPAILFPSLLEASPLVVLTRDPRAVAMTRFHRLREAGRWRSDLAAFLASPIYGVVRQARFVDGLLDLHDRHSGPKAWLRLGGAEADASVLARAISVLTREPVHQRRLQAAIASTALPGSLGDQPTLHSGGWRDADVEPTVWDAYARQPDVARLLERMKLN